MAGSFCENLSALRKERRLNQRAAAAKLGISQALLSHYENGIREPGLDFVDRACGFYGVSADYLLGRTELRSTAYVTGSAPSGAAAERMRNAIDSSFALFRTLTSGDEARARLAFHYLSCAEYRLMRRLGIGEGEGFFTVPREDFDILCAEEAARLEYKMRDGAAPAVGADAAAPLRDLAAREETRLAALIDD